MSNQPINPGAEESLSWWRLAKRQVKRSYAAALENYYERRVLPRLRNGIQRVPRETPVVVSLTTIPRRLFDKTYLTIVTLLNQQFPPDRVILWVSDTQQDKPLPSVFTQLCDAGLEVRYCQDVGPHTKLVYALKEYPESIVVTADDDRLYPSQWLGDLYCSYQGAPQHIHTHRAHLMRLDDRGKLAPYVQWSYLAPGVKGPSKWLFLTGTSGVLYPPQSLADDVLDVARFRELCPTADDVWFAAMALLRGTLCQKVRVRSREFATTNGSQTEALINVNNHTNDLQVRATFEHYDLYRLLQ